MLDYAPDGLTAGSIAPLGQELTVIWQAETVPDEALLANLLAASRASGGGGTCTMSTGADIKNNGFQPERVSGFCASC